MPASSFTTTSMQILRKCCLADTQKDGKPFDKVDSYLDEYDGEKAYEAAKKKYLDEAIELSPNASIYHMRGRFAYEVANLSWLQLTAATELFGAPPTATIDEALADLLKAEDVNPGELDNLLFIAKGTSEARTYLLRMNEDSAVDEADEEMLKEKRQLLKSIADDSSNVEEQTAKEMSFAGVEASPGEAEEVEQLSSAIEAADHSHNETQCA